MQEAELEFKANPSEEAGEQLRQVHSMKDKKVDDHHDLDLSVGDDDDHHDHDHDVGDDDHDN